MSNDKNVINQLFFATINRFKKFLKKRNLKIYLYIKCEFKKFSKNKLREEKYNIKLVCCSLICVVVFIADFIYSPFSSKIATFSKSILSSNVLINFSHLKVSLLTQLLNYF